MKLCAENVSVGYSRTHVVFSGIRFSADEGDMIALLGVNGIGKSTLLRTVAGLQKSIGGKLTIGGQIIESLPVKERAMLISIVLTEKIFVDNITVKDFIALGRAPYTRWLGNLSEKDLKEVHKVIALMGVEKLEHKPVNELSDGERQKILIARALSQETPVMILDEPTAFLDFRNKKEVLGLLSSISKELKKIVILSTHDIEAATEYCNTCWIMKEDKTFDIIGHTANFREEVMRKLFVPVSGSHT